jgi:DNA helicase-2/ATP-dependent DNA helicase PcrA
MSAQQMQAQKFSTVYDALNEQQRLAVDNIDGPVMVIAGPGTGKTQILSARIGKILMDTDALPENILCLTYTDAGVVAMRKRLQQFIGADAYKVNLYTFHAFCNDIIQENLSLFEKTALDPISDLERIEYFKELIDGFPKNHPLKRYRGDVYFEIHNLHSLFSHMKKEGWTPKYIEQCIDAYLADIPNRPEYIYSRKYKQFNAGDLKLHLIEQETEKMEKLRAAIHEFDRFQQLMRSRNRYDFDDMINWVIKAFESNAALLANYQEKFLYILVDEYQDTSGTQNKLVQLLINYWDKPNVFVVGDDDQSIYRFQGANIENMLAFAESYQKNLLTVVLTQNYRSVQPVLDISKTLINKNTERLVQQIPGLSKDLVTAKESIKHLTTPPVIAEYATQRQEMIHLVIQIEQLLQQGVPAGKIAVLYKEHKYGDELTTYCKLKNIPVYSKRQLNLFDIPLAQKIILLLQYLSEEHHIPYSGDEKLFELLHADWFGIPPIDIAKLSVAVAQRNYKEDKTAIRQALYEKVHTPGKDLFSAPPHQGLQQASNAIEKLIADVPNVTVQQLFENIIREAGVLNFIMQSPDKHWLLAVLTALFDFVKEETRRKPDIRLQQLVTVIELMKKEALPLKIVEVSGNEKGVNLLTTHGSKGLEFEHVFVAGCNASFWEKKRKPGGGYSYPDTLFVSQPKQVEEEELRRLFYVALTRAELHLQISYSQFANDGKLLEPSIFIAEIQETHQLPVQKVILDDEVLSSFSALHFSEGLQPEIAKAEDDFITPILDKFVMNVTALNAYLKCPLQFYFTNLVRVPSGKSEATEFGSAVHHALQQLFEKMQQSNNTFPSKQVFINDFEWYMKRHRESFTKEQYDRRIEYGQEVLINYYDKYIGSFNTIVAVERNIRNVTLGNVPLKGKLDKLEFNGKEVNVVDYKTGNVDNAKSKLLPPNEKDPNGGDYWRQAVFYKILVDNYEQKDWKVISTEFDFIEPDKKKNYQKAKIVISPQDITTVTEQVKMVWEKIQNRDFYTGCGKADCHWCNFAKTNQLAIALHDSADDQTDD